MSNIKARLSVWLTESLGCRLEDEDRVDAAMREDSKYFHRLGGAFLSLKPDRVRSTLCCYVLVFSLEVGYVYFALETLLLGELTMEGTISVFNTALLTALALVTRWSAVTRRRALVGLYLGLGAEVSRSVVRARRAMATLWPGSLLLVGASTYLAPLLRPASRASELPIPVRLPLPFLPGLLFELLTTVDRAFTIGVLMDIFVVTGCRVLAEVDTLLDVINSHTAPTLIRSSSSKPLRKSSTAEIIRYHQLVLKLIEDYSAVVGPPVLLMISLSSILIAFCSFCITSREMTLVAKIPAVTLIVPSFLSVWVTCYFGEKIVTKMDALRDALYFSDWIPSDRGVRRMMIIMQIKMFKEISITGYYLNVRANYKTFRTIINSVYTYVNMLYAFQSSRPT